MLAGGEKSVWVKFEMVAHLLLDSGGVHIKITPDYKVATTFYFFLYIPEGAE